MQISINKHIVLIIFWIAPIVLFAQLGRKKYVTRSGDTTIVVMTNSGLSSDDSQFLLEHRVSQELLTKKNRYARLKDAVTETNQVADIVEIEKEETNPTTGSLSFRIAQQNIRFLQKEREAERLARDGIINSRSTTVEEMAYLKEKFGNKPSYFINGIAVDPRTALSLPQRDVLTKELRVANTSTGNPNGEVWLIVNTNTLNRLNLDVHYAENNVPPKVQDDFVQPSSFYDTDTFLNQSQEEDPWEELAPIVSPTKSASVLSQPIQNDPVVINELTLGEEQRSELSDQEREIEELRKAILGYGQKPVVSSPTHTLKEIDANNAAIAARKAESAQPATESRVITRKVGNRFVDSGEEIVSFRDSPQERSRRNRDAKGGDSAPQESLLEEVIQVTNQAEDDVSNDPSITKETPKRSIRRIKERQRNQ